jgi:hypothetical protein
MTSEVAAHASAAIRFGFLLAPECRCQRMGQAPRSVQPLPTRPNPFRTGRRMPAKITNKRRGDTDELQDELAKNSHVSDAREGQKTPTSSAFCGGGAERDRTADLLIANEGLAPANYVTLSTVGFAFFRLDFLAGKSVHV